MLESVCQRQEKWLDLEEKPMFMKVFPSSPRRRDGYN